MLWDRWKSDRTLGKKAGLGRRTTFDPSGEKVQQSLWTDSAWSSPILLAEVMARRKAIFRESHFRSTLPRGSKGGCFRASRTR